MLNNYPAPLDVVPYFVRFSEDELQSFKWKKNVKLFYTEL